MDSEINKEEMWLSLETPLKSFLDKSFESKLIRKQIVDFVLETV